MAIVFCAPFDKDFKTCVPVDLIPSVTTNGVISTTTKKFGLGSLANKLGSAPLPGFQYSSISVMPDNEGAIGFWWQDAELAAAWRIEVRINPLFGQRIWFQAAWSPAPFSQLYYVLSMDDGVGVVFNNIAVVVATSPDSNFHHAELNWLWNDVSGKTEMFYNGSSIWDSTAGNSKTRAGGGDATVRIDMFTPTIEASFLDDFVIADARLHTSGFAVPGGPLCPCGKRLVTLGTPLGIPNNLGK